MCSADSAIKNADRARLAMRHVRALLEDVGRDDARRAGAFPEFLDHLVRRSMPTASAIVLEGNDLRAHKGCDRIGDLSGLVGAKPAVHRGAVLFTRSRLTASPMIAGFEYIISTNYTHSAIAPSILTTVSDGNQYLHGYMAQRIDALKLGWCGTGHQLRI